MLDWIMIITAFGLGVLASFNPCGFAILPGFVTYYIGSAEGQDNSSPKRIARGLFLSLVATLSLVLLFTLLGLVFIVTGQSVLSIFPWNQLIIGLLLLSLSIFLLVTKRSLGIEKTHRFIEHLKVSRGRSFWFGLAYGIGSLGCTIAPFLTVSANSLASNSIVSRLVQFASFGLGMGVVIIAIVIVTSHFMPLKTLSKARNYLLITTPYPTQFLPTRSSPVSVLPRTSR